MPKVRNLYASFGSLRKRAMFIAAIMLFNLFLTTFSGSVAYADTAIVEVETTEVAEVEVVETESTESEEESTEEAVEEEATEEEAEESSDEQEEVVVVATDLPIDEDYPVIEGSFVCWYPNNSFVVSVTSDGDYEDENAVVVGTDFNESVGNTHDDILPTEFEDGTNDVLVEGWDGVEFEWVLGGNEVGANTAFTVSQNGPFCDDAPTIRDLIEEDEDLTSLSRILSVLEEQSPCAKQIDSLSHWFEREDDGRVRANGVEDEFPGYTVFAPSNDAFANLVQNPPGPTAEFGELMDYRDELCALIASHIVMGVVLSVDITENGLTVFTVENDVDGIFLVVTETGATADGASITSADNMALNGVVHVVNRVLLPQSAGTIDPIVTDSTQPVLTGSINLLAAPVDEHSEEDELDYPAFCVTVRIDGTPLYNAIVDGLSWSLDLSETEVEINPTDSETLFDVVVRHCGFTCFDDIDRVCFVPVIGVDTPDRDPVRITGPLMGLTMARGVVSYPEPVEEPEETGEVLGTKTEKNEEVAAAVSCGKGLCGEYAPVDPSTIDSDGDGVVDSEDPAPFDPNITGLETDDSDENTDDSDEDEEDDENDVFWWFIVGGGITVLAYLYRQRTGYNS